jgi:hypothetical protein
VVSNRFTTLLPPTCGRSNGRLRETTGTTAEFCTESESETGNPGTAAPGENGCISNCGTDIVNNSEGPVKFSKVAYFEAWNMDRPCLNMDVDSIDTSVYSHIHFAFATITESWDVFVNNTDQFNRFKNMNTTNAIRVLAFGGWAFSTDPTTYYRFRDAVSPAYRDIFSTNVANFIALHGMDGVDFDWEYPGVRFTIFLSVFHLPLRLFRYLTFSSSPVFLLRQVFIFPPALLHFFLCFLSRLKPTDLSGASTGKRTDQRLSWNLGP